MSTGNIIVVDVENDTFCLREQDVVLYPSSTIACATTFYRQRETDRDKCKALDFKYRSSQLFGIIKHVYETGTVPNTAKDVPLHQLREELMFWGFDVRLPSEKYDSKAVHIPWGIWARSEGLCVWKPLVVFFWNTLLKSEALQNTASRGFRETVLYCRHFADSVVPAGSVYIDVSLLVTHFDYTRRLAEESCMSIEVMSGTFGHHVQNECCSYDVFSNSTVKIDPSSWFYVDHFDFDALLEHTYNVSVSSCAKHSHTFTAAGLECTVDIDNDTLSWTLSEVHEKQHPARGDDLLQRCNVLLRLSIVVNKTMFEGIIVPVHTTRVWKLSFNQSLSRSYLGTLPDWYKHLPNVQSTLLRTPVTTKYPNNPTVTLLVEAATEGTLDVQQVKQTSKFYGDYYERFKLAW